MKSRIILILILVSTFLACNKEDAELKLTITPSSLDIDSGETIDFAINGTSEFLVYFSGLEGQKYSEYPNSNAVSINMQTDNPSLSRSYNLHGSVDAVFVATSYGNWGEDKIDQIFEFTINVTDNNSALKFATLKTPGLFGKEYEGILDQESGTISAAMPKGTNIKKLTTNLVTDSPLSSIFLDGSDFKNKSQVDFSATNSKTFIVRAIGGAETNWVVNIDLQ